MAAPRKCLSTDEKFRNAVAASLPIAQVLAQIGLVPAGGNYKAVQSCLRQLGLSTSYLTGAAWNQGERYRAIGKCAPLKEVLVENPIFNFIYSLKKRLLK